MKSIVLLFLQLSCLSSINVNDNIHSAQKCQGFIFYKTSLENINVQKNKPLLVKFDYFMSSSLKNSVFGGSFFEEKEKTIILKGLEKSKRKLCPDLRKKLIEMQALNSAPENTKLFTEINYSEPIQISEQKVYLFVDFLNKTSDEIVVSGANILQVFIKHENGWSLNKTRLLEQY